MSLFRPVNSDDFSWIASFVGQKNVSCGEDINARFSADETEDLKFTPELVVCPANTAEVSKVLAYCNQHNIPVTPRGAGTGLAGGCLPVFGGVVLSLHRMNRILHLDEANLQVTVEPGVITEVLQQMLQEKGLYYPPDPASRGSCFIGGNVATNSGGPRAVKYGVVKDYVLNLEVVLPDGTIFMTGANTLKNSTGYNLTQLMVGSEGTLCVVTKIVLRLIPYPRFRYLLLASFNTAEKACEAVSAIFRAGITPSALEFMERDAILLAAAYVGTEPPGIHEHTGAQLLIEVDGFETASMELAVETIYKVLKSFDCTEVLFADNAEQQQQLWHLRRNMGHAVKNQSVYKEEDTVVPRASLPQLLKFVKESGDKYGFRSICYGHAGDGNLHVNILRDQLSGEFWTVKLPEAITEIFTEVKRLQGALSGEHGIGFVQKNYMPISVDEVSLKLMKDIKNIFDPNGIMNPGKVFPDN